MKDFIEFVWTALVLTLGILFIFWALVGCSTTPVDSCDDISYIIWTGTTGHGANEYRIVEKTIVYTGCDGFVRSHTEWDIQNLDHEGLR